MKRDELFRFFSGEASYAEEVKVRKWAEASEENRNRLLKERRVFDSMILLTGEARAEEKKVGRRFSIGKGWSRAAAAFVAALCVSSLLQYVFREEVAAPMLSFYVPEGQRMNLTLPDGTDVWLNSDTKIDFPSSFSGDTRTVCLSGEAFFDVKRDEKRPFVVNTDKCRMEVLGTKFNVSAYGDSPIREVSLLEGRVRVSSLSEGGNALVLAPGMKAVLADNGRMVEEKITDYGEYRWTEGLICFEQASFNEIMEKLEKVYGVEIKVWNADVEKHRYTGKFRYADGVDHALRVLQKNIDFDYLYDENTNAVNIK